MATDAIQWLPHVWPHPVHATLGGAGSSSSNGSSKQPLGPLRPKGPRGVRRKDELEAVLHRVISNSVGMASEQQTASQSSGYRAGLSNTSLLVQGPGGDVLSLPLLMTDVVEAVLPIGRGADYAIALASRPEEMTFSLNSPESRFSESSPLSQPDAMASNPPLSDVWIFLVAGSPLKLKQLCFDLGGRGALRWDLHECYTLTRKSLGEGGCGKVFLGQSLSSDQARGTRNRSGEAPADGLSVHQVAIKILNQDQSRPEEVLMRREIGFLARTRGHPNITALYGVFCCYDQNAGERGDLLEDDDEHREPGLHWFIAMELCSGGDLFDYIQSAGPLDDKGCVVVMVCLFLALRHVHRLQIVHRDVKPENILMGAQSRATLADFGIASHVDDTVEMKQMLGTPGYAAPEVVTGQKYDCLADVFSAGCVFYFGLCNKQPFHGDTLFDTLQLTAHCDPKYTKRRFGHASTGIVSLMQFCLKKNPGARPCTEQALAALKVHVKENFSKYSDSNVITEWLALDNRGKRNIDDPEDASASTMPQRQFSPQSQMRQGSHSRSEVLSDPSESQSLLRKQSLPSTRAAAQLEAASASAAFPADSSLVAVNVALEEVQEAPVDESQGVSEPQRGDPHEPFRSPCHSPTSHRPEAPAPPSAPVVPKPSSTPSRFHRKQSDESESHSELQQKSGKPAVPEKPGQDHEAQAANADKKDDKRRPSSIRSTLGSMAPSKTWQRLTSAFRKASANTSEKSEEQNESSHGATSSSSGPRPPPPKQQQSPSSGSGSGSHGGAEGLRPTPPKSAPPPRPRPVGRRRSGVGSSSGAGSGE